jgi:WD40 repeat protein
MDSYISNITTLNKTENNFSFTYEGRLYYLKLSTLGNRITLKLKDENALIHFTANITLSEANKEKLFDSCETIEDLKEIVDQIITEGKIILQVSNDNVYKLTLFNKLTSIYFSVNILFKREEMLNNDNFLDEKLEALASLSGIEDTIKLHYYTVLESLKANNKEISALREEVKSCFEKSTNSFHKHSNNIFKAIIEFDNYVLQSDSTESLIFKTRLYKDVLNNLQDDTIGNWLKESFCCLQNAISNIFISYEAKMKDESFKQSEKESNLTQTIKELKNELIEQKAKEDNLTQIIKELKDQLLNQKTKEDNLTLVVKELKEELLKQCPEESNCVLSDKEPNKYYSNFNLTSNTLAEDVQTIQRYLDDLNQNNIKQFNDSMLEIENNNVTYCKLIKDNTNNIEYKIFGDNEDYKLFPRNMLKDIKSNVIIGDHDTDIHCMISLPNSCIVSASPGTINISYLYNNILITKKERLAVGRICLALLQDGNIVSDSLYDDTIKIWDTQSDYKCINTLSGHTNSITSLLVLKNGNIVSGSNDKCMKIWECNTYQCIKTIEEHSKSVVSLINLIDGFYASGSIDNTFKVWNANSECVNTVKEDYPVYSLLLLPGDNIASGSYKTIKIWKCDNDYKDIRCIHTLKGHTSCIYTLYLVNNDYILSGSYTTIKVWDIKNDYQCINTLTGHNGAISSLLILDNSRLISSSSDGTIRLWN